MQIALDSTSSGQRTTSGTSTTVSHTVNANGDGILIVCVSQVSSSVVSGVTYGGVAMTKVIERNDGDYKNCSIWRLLTPAIGTANIVVSHSSTSILKVFGASFLYVRQDTPIGATASATGGQGTAPNCNITTTQNNSVIISVLSRGAQNGSPSMGTPNSGQVTIESDILYASHWGGATRETKAVAGLDNQGWSLVDYDTPSNSWSMCSIELLLDPNTETTVSITGKTLTWSATQTYIPLIGAVISFVAGAINTFKRSIFANQVKNSSTFKDQEKH